MILPTNLTTGDKLGSATIIAVGKRPRVDQPGNRVTYTMRCECGEEVTRTRESLGMAIKRNTGFYCRSCAQKYKRCTHENGVRLSGQEAKYQRQQSRRADRPTKESRYYTFDELRGLHDWGYHPREA